MGYIWTTNFNRIGKVDSDGYIYSESFERLGKIDKDGRIFAENFSYVGRIDTDGFIWLSNGQRIGRIHQDGYVYDELFNCVGRIEPDIVDYIFKNNKCNKPLQSKSIESSNLSSSTGTGSAGCGATAAGCLSTFLGISAGIAVGAALSSFGFGLIVFIIVYNSICCMIDGFKYHIGDTILSVFIILITLFFMNA